MTWLEILEDPDVARLEYRVESDRWGNLLMSRSFQLAEARPSAQFEGVRACDVAWASRARRNSTNRKPVFTVAPEICVEIQSPSNSLPQIMERKDWFFASGAIEFSYCDPYGRMHFFNADGPLEQSALCPKFPTTITVD